MWIALDDRKCGVGECSQVVCHPRARVESCVYVVANRLRLIRESVCTAISEFRVEQRFTDIFTLPFMNHSVVWDVICCLQKKKF